MESVCKSKPNVYINYLIFYSLRQNIKDHTSVTYLEF